MPNPILCLDFDGVLHSYKSGWQGAAVIPDPPVPGAINFLCNAIDHFQVHIFSSRSHQDGAIAAMKSWLALHAQNVLNNNGWRRRLMNEIQWPQHKPPASVSIDDRCLTFTGRWPSMAELKAFKPWNYGNGSSKSLDAAMLQSTITEEPQVKYVVGRFTINGREITTQDPLVVSPDAGAVRQVIDQFAANEERKLWNAIRDFLQYHIISCAPPETERYIEAKDLLNSIDRWCPPGVNELLPANRHNGYPK